MELLTDEQDTQGAGAAVAGDGAAGISFIDIVKMAVLCNGCLDGGIALVGYGGLGDKQGAVVQILTTGEAILNIACQALVVLTAILLHNAHLAVTNFNAGLQVQQVCAQSGCGRAAATLDQVIQLVNQEACFHLGGEGLQLLCQGVQVGSGLGQFAGFQNNQTLASGQVTGVDDPDVGVIRCGQTCVLVAGGEFRADVDVDDTVIVGSELCENIFVFTDAVGCSGAQSAAGGNMGKNFSGGDGNAVFELQVLSEMILIFMDGNLRLISSGCWLFCHHAAIGFDGFFAEIGAAPIPHGNQNGHQASAQFGQGIFHLGGNYGEHFPVNQIVGFQFPKLLGQHLGSSALNCLTKLGKAKFLLSQIPENQGLVFAADKLQGGSYGAVFVFNHGKPPLVS